MGVITKNGIHWALKEYASLESKLINNNNSKYN